MKTITADNYNVRPFVTHKTQTYGYTFLSGGNPDQVAIDLAVVPPTASTWQAFSGNDNPSGINKHTLYESVKHMFYETSTVNRAFEPTGSSLYVISVAQTAYGEQVRPGTFVLTEGSSVGAIVDDGNGGLIFSGSDSSSMFRYAVGDDIAALGGTFIGPLSRSYRDADGYLRYVDVDVPRDSHYVYNNGTQQFERTLLYEPTRTNTTVDLTLWSRVSSSFSQSMAVSPDGVSLAGKLIESSTSSLHYMHRAQPFTALSTQSVSIWARAEERSVFEMYLSSVGGSGSCGVVCDTTTGAVTIRGDTLTAKTLSSSSVAYANGWFRFGFSGAFSTNTVTTASLVILLRSGSSTSYLGDGTSGLYLYGPQMEEGHVLSSYIPTSGSSVTRTNEVLKFSFSELPQELSVNVKFVDLGIGQYMYPTVFSIGKRFDMYTGGGGFTGKVVDDIGSSSLSPTTASLTRVGDHVDATVNIQASGSGMVSFTRLVKNGTTTHAGDPLAIAFKPSTFDSPTLFVGHSPTTAGTSGLLGVKELTVKRRAQFNRLGNIFYSNGIAVINKDSMPVPIRDVGMSLNTGSAMTVRFDATHTIYEHSIICTMDSGEFNYSINPSVKNTSLDGNKVIDYLATGSLTPYMTQIGLYNDDGELVAIGKFPRPLKRAVGSQQTVIIRFDA